MARIIFLMMLISIINISHIKSQDRRYVVDQWDKSKTNIIDSNGNITGYAKQDQWDKAVMNIYDSNGSLIRQIKKDQWDSEKTNIYNQHGNLERSEKKDQWNAKRINIYDDEGNLTGYKEPDQWESDKINFFNNEGYLIGFYTKNRWTGDFEYTKSLSTTPSRLKTYSPNGFNSSNELKFQSTLDIPVLDLSGLEELSRTASEIDDRRIQRIQNDILYWEKRIQNARTETEKNEAIAASKLWEERTFPKEKEEEKPAKLNYPTKVEINGKTKIVIYPKVEKYDNSNIQITKVELNKNETIIHIRYINDGNSWVNINNNACIYDKKAMYKINDINKAIKILKIIKDSKIVPFAPYKYTFKNRNEILEFKLIFPGIDWKKTEVIDLLECQESSCLNVYGINLK